MSSCCCCRGNDKDKAAEKKEKALDEKQEKALEEALLEIYLKALDDLVNVNSLFTFAVFLGLSYASPGNLSLENRPECNADSGVAKRLVVFEVVSFSLFLMSSLVAKTLKFHFFIHRQKYFGKVAPLSNCRRWILMFTAGGSILGCVFLTISIVHVIEIKVGKLSCGSRYTVGAVASLITIVGIAVCIYTCTIMEAISASDAKLVEIVDSDPRLQRGTEGGTNEEYT